jgi:hypothetical protein
MTTTLKNPTTWLARDDFIKAVLASDLPDKAARVLVRLVMYLNIDSGRIDPSYKKLAESSGVKERSVYRILPLLESLAWIRIERSDGRLSNQYVLNTAIQTAVLNTATHMAALKSPTLPNRGSNTAKSSAQHCHTLADKKQEKSKRKEGKKDSRAGARANESPPDVASLKKSKQTKPDLSPEIAEAFARFWAAYPKHDAEEPARKAFARAIKDTDPETIIAGARCYALAEQMRLARPGQIPQHTAMAKNWLRERRWNDDPPPGAVIDEAGNVVAIEQDDNAASSRPMGFVKLAAMLYPKRGTP